LSRLSATAGTAGRIKVPRRNRVYVTDEGGRTVIIGHIRRLRGRPAQYVAGLPECYVAHPRHHEDQAAVTETWEAAQTYLRARWDARELVQ
jgi:hypothetical protein